jgi:IS1 family transposase
VLWERTTENLQEMLNRSPKARRYYSDEFKTYQTLNYATGRHQALPDKSETYSVEADNAELRHYLAGLARKSRCFSRRIHALWRAVKLFVFAWNRRQLFLRAHPHTTAHVKDFLYP